MKKKQNKNVYCAYVEQYFIFLSDSIIVYSVPRDEWFLMVLFWAKKVFNFIVFSRWARAHTRIHVQFEGNKQHKTIKHFIMKNIILYCVCIYNRIWQYVFFLPFYDTSYYYIPCLDLKLDSQNVLVIKRK